MRPPCPWGRTGADDFGDGGRVPKTPRERRPDESARQNSPVLQADLFSARGEGPRDIQEGRARHKDIMYSSRTRHNTDVYRRTHNLKVLLYKALAKLPDEQLSDEERKLKGSLCHMPEIAILHLIYQQKAYEGDAKDHEFSGTSMREHWTSGYEDTKRTLKRRDWIKMPEEGMGLVVHDVHRETESA